MFDHGVEDHGWRRGYEHVRILSDGQHFTAVQPLLFGQGRIVRGMGGSLGGPTEEWMYATYRQAVAAYETWDGDVPEAEPVGWTRHKPSNRRRFYHEDGTLASEQVWA